MRTIYSLLIITLILASCSKKKTNSLNEKDLTEFVEMAKTKELNDNSWLVDIKTVNKDTWDLNVNNPNIFEEVDNFRHNI